MQFNNSRVVYTLSAIFDKDHPNTRGRLRKKPQEKQTEEL